MLIKLLPKEIQHTLYIKFVRLYQITSGDIVEKEIEKKLPRLPNEIKYKILNSFMLDNINKNKLHLITKLFSKIIDLKIKNSFKDSQKIDALEKYKKAGNVILNININTSIPYNQLELDLIKNFKTKFFLANSIINSINKSEETIQNLDEVLLELFENQCNVPSLIPVCINGSEKKIQNLDVVLFKLFEMRNFDIHDIKTCINGSEKKIQNLDAVLFELFERSFVIHTNFIETCINGSERKIQNLDEVLFKLFEMSNYFNINDIKACINGSEKKIQNLDAVLFELFYKTNRVNGDAIEVLIEASDRKVLLNKELYRNLQEKFPEQAKLVSLYNHVEKNDFCIQNTQALEEIKEKSSSFN